MSVVYRAVSPFGAVLSTTDKEAARSYRREGWKVEPYVRAIAVRHAADILDRQGVRSVRTATEILRDLLDEAEM